MNQQVNLFATIEEGGGFGHQKRMPWPSIGLVMENLLNKTTDSDFIFGRNTIESMHPTEVQKILSRNQKIIVVSKTLTPQQLPEGVILAGSLEAALSISKSPRVSLLGGFGIYKDAIKGNLAHALYRTNIHQKFTCDVFFPKLGDEWQIESKGDKVTDPKSNIEISFDKLINTKNPFMN